MFTNNVKHIPVYIYPGTKYIYLDAGFCGRAETDVVPVRGTAAEAVRRLGPNREHALLVNPSASICGKLPGIHVQERYALELLIILLCTVCAVQ